MLSGLILILYGIIPTLGASHFGRMHSVYGGFFFVLALTCGRYINGDNPDLANRIGAGIALPGVCVMMYWLRASVERPSTLAGLEASQIANIQTGENVTP